MSTSSEKSQQRRVKNKKKGYVCSTPVLGNLNVLSSPLTSAIDTNSSTSTKINQPRRSERISQVRKAIRRRKSQQMAKLRKKRKKRKVVLRVSSNSDWETQSERSVHSDIGNADEKSTGKNSSNSPNMLFQDLGSPEVTRRANFAETQLESPLFCSTRRQIIDTTKQDFEQQEVRLESVKLPRLKLPIIEDDENREDSSWMLYKAPVPKTYQPAVKKEKVVVKFDRSKDWLISPRKPTAYSNLLWDAFLERNPDVVQKYSLQPTPRSEKICSFDYIPLDVNKLCKRYRENHNNDKQTNKNVAGVKSIGKKKAKEKPSLRPKPSEFERVHGFADKQSQEWTIITDQYEFSEPEDMDLINDKKTGKRMSFAEFHREIREGKLKKKHILRRKTTHPSELSLDRSEEENVADELTSRLKRKNQHDTSSEEELPAKRRKSKSLVAKKKNKPQITSLESFNKQVTKLTNKWKIVDS